MRLENYLVLAATCFVAMIVPGPGVMAVVGRALAVGWRRNLAFIAGMALGDVSMLAVAMSGMAALALSFAPVLEAVKIGGGLYLLWLGWRAWNAPAASLETVGQTVPGGRRAFAAGWALTMANPKVILFYMAVLPAVVDLPHLSAWEAVSIGALVCALVFAVMLGYSLACAGARRLFTRPGGARLLSRGSGGIMIGAGLAIATS